MTSTRARAVSFVSDETADVAGAVSVAGTSSFGASTGSTTVNVDPSPGVLTTVMSPPSNWQNMRLMANPSPVPPYFLVVESSACENAWNRRPTCTGVIPIP